MRSVLASLVALAASSTVAAAPQYKFGFTVRVDHDPAIQVSAEVPPGTSHVLQATHHLRFEVIAPNATNDAATTVVRLIDDSSGKPVVLHTSYRTGSVALERDFAYAICSGKVTFQSPSLGKPIQCQ